MATFLCMKWGTKYGPEYVNRLHAMVKRQMSGPFRFVCLTDSREGLDPGIEAFPIPSLRLPPGSPERGWTKLVSFSPELTAPGGPQLSGPILFLDIDIVIVGPLDDFFRQPGEFLIMRERKRFRIQGNSSVYRWTAGAHTEVLDYFRANLDTVRTRHRNEQEFLVHYLSNQGKVTFWPETWCRSFKRHCVYGFPLSLVFAPRIPEDARIVIFHGLPNPPDALVGRSGKWYRWVKPTAWIAQYWRV